MIKNRLSELISERGLNITKISRETGISRNSITSIAQNDSEMFRIETINTLCKYFGITPGDFFEFEPIDIAFSVDVRNISYQVTHPEIDPYATEEYFSINNIDVDLIMKINKNSKDNVTKLVCSLYETISFPLYTSSQYTHGIEINIDFETENEENDYIAEIQSKINPSFHEDIYNLLVNSINDALTNWIQKDFYSTRYSDKLKEKFTYSTIEYLFVRTIHTDVFKKR